MALLIKSTDDSKLYLRGTDIVLDELYARVQFTGYPDGKKIEACLSYYQTKEKYLENKYLPIDMVANYYFNIGEFETQSLLTVHEHLINLISEFGYEVVNLL
jgi:hypothetical protein